MLSKKSVIILRVGLGLVFLSNALAAWFSPGEFKELVEGSFLIHLFPSINSSVFVTLILINDSLLALTFLFNLQFIKKALVWASIYLVIVMLVIWEPLAGLEHMGFLAMAIALFLENNNKS